MMLNNKNVHFDISDPRDARRYEETLARLEEKKSALKEDKKEYTLEETMREIIKICRETMLDFTGVDVLKGCYSAVKAKEVLHKFYAEVEKQTDNFVSPFDIDRIQ